MISDTPTGAPPIAFVDFSGTARSAMRHVEEGFVAGGARGERLLC
jgi:hypothetical protein